VTALVVAIGVVFNWWLAGIVLVQICGVMLFAFEGFLRKPALSRAVLSRLALTLGGCVLGVALFFGNGGFGRFHTSGEERRVERFGELALSTSSVSVEKVTARRVAGCEYTVWDVRSRRIRIYVVSTATRVAVADPSESAEDAIANQVAARRVSRRR